MKKAILLILFLPLLALTLSCCAEKTEQTPRGMSYPMTAELKVALDGKEYGMTLNFKDEGEGTLTFSSPSSIRGLKLTFDKSGGSLSYCGVKVPIDTDYASKHGILMLRDILTAKKESFAGAKMVKRSGVSYCRERYEGDGYRIDVFFVDNNAPSFIEAEVGGRKMEIIFVNNQ